jgi:hypothetical protein
MIAKAIANVKSLFMLLQIIGSRTDELFLAKVFEVNQPQYKHWKAIEQWSQGWPDRC